MGYGAISTPFERSHCCHHHHHSIIIIIIFFVIIAITPPSPFLSSSQTTPALSPPSQHQHSITVAITITTTTIIKTGKVPHINQTRILNRKQIAWVASFRFSNDFLEYLSSRTQPSVAINFSQQTHMPQISTDHYPTLSDESNQLNLIGSSTGLS